MMSPYFKVKVINLLDNYLDGRMSNRTGTAKEPAGYFYSNGNNFRNTKQICFVFHEM